MIIAFGTAIVLTIAFLLGIFIVAPIIGWKVALNYLYARYCLYAADPAADPLAAWDCSLAEATDANGRQVWRQLFSPDTHTREVEDYFEAKARVW